jgi:hypothetical protein
LTYFHLFEMYLRSYLWFTVLAACLCLSAYTESLHSQIKMTPEMKNGLASLLDPNRDGNITSEEVKTVLSSAADKGILPESVKKWNYEKIGTVKVEDFATKLEELFKQYSAEDLLGNQIYSEKDFQLVNAVVNAVRTAKDTKCGPNSKKLEFSDLVDCAKAGNCKTVLTECNDGSNTVSVKKRGIIKGFFSFVGAILRIIALIGLAFIITIGLIILVPIIILFFRVLF